MINVNQADILAFLKTVVEGGEAGMRWHQWLKSNESILKKHLPPGSYLRLKFHPVMEAKQILDQQKIVYNESDRFEWLDINSTTGRCRYCGEVVQRFKGGGGRCPNGCFQVLT